MKKICFLAPILFLIFSGCISSDNHNYDSKDFIDSHEHLFGTVTRVVDGDTVHVDSNGVDYNIRLLGVDTPETYQKNSVSEYYLDYETPISDTGYLDYWGHLATNYTRDTLENKSVYVVFDKKSDKQDKYGRYLAYIYLKNENFNENLIEYGFARVYTSDFELKNEFLETEKTAKSDRIGLWNYNN
ncbi:micrococcal nuclease [Methanococcus maripaludis]|uniref:Micrococcal nuclease n=1 Tax=Methanococcus maripaludis TaxID=39152 RepID=A0A7J9NXB4_METMI|nr:thermonuclease family protein [Methanococcus maripaludis]MBA2850396.1 micrococcal nuclease [Methanococcus maripaludis]